VSARVEELGASADERRPFVHVRAEPERQAASGSSEFLVRMRVWPGGDDRLLGRTVGHGMPTVWT